MKIAVVYYSRNGHTKEMAEIIKKAMLTEEGIEAEIFDLDNIDYDYIKESKAVVFGTPTYYANTCWQMKKWFDESWGCNLEGKIGAVYGTADYVQGGVANAMLTIINHLIVKGMLVYSGGSALGQPYLHLGAVATKDRYEESKKEFEIFGKRIAKKVIELFN